MKWLLLFALPLFVNGCNGTLESQLGLRFDDPSSGPQTVKLDDRLTPYVQNGGIVTDAHIQQLKQLQMPQSQETINRLLPSPKRVSEGQSTWEIANTSDGIMAPKQLVVLFRPGDQCQRRCYEAYDWYVPGGYTPVQSANQ